MRVLWDINTKEIKLLMKVLYKSIENSETPNKDEITRIGAKSPFLQGWDG